MITVQGAEFVRDTSTIKVENIVGYLAYMVLDSSQVIPLIALKIKQNKQSDENKRERHQLIQ